MERTNYRGIRRGMQMQEGRLVYSLLAVLIHRLVKFLLTNLMGGSGRRVKESALGMHCLKRS